MREVLFLLLMLVSASCSAQTVEWLRDIDVIKVGAYQSSTVHFVWFTKVPAECMSVMPSTMYFDDAQPGGKALMAVLISAVVSKRKVDVQADACKIVEVYLK